MAIRKFARSRGLIAGLVGVFLAGVVFTPAIAGHSTQHNQNQINNNQQINQQQAQRLTNQRGTLSEFKSFAAEGDDPTAGDSAGEDITLFTHGPLTWFMRCFEDRGGGGTDEIELFVTSSEDFFTSFSSGSQAAGTEVLMESASATTGASEQEDDIDSGSASSVQDGTLFVSGIDIESFAYLFNLSGSTCATTGFGYKQSLPV